MNKALFSLIIGVFLFNWSFCQSGTVSSGGHVSNGTTAVSFSIGQVFDNYASNSLNNLNEGVQQPSMNELTKSKDLSHTAVLQLNQSGNLIELTAPSGHTYILMSGDGKILESKNSNFAFSTIDLNHYLPGIYYLGVFVKESNLKTFKVLVL